MTVWKNALLALVSIATVVGVEVWGSTHLGGCVAAGGAGSDFTKCDARCDDDGGAIEGCFECCEPCLDDQDLIDQECFDVCISGGDVDADGDGVTVGDGDCNDTDASVFPGAAEFCNDIDDDCDEQTDEGLGGPFYADADADGFGDPALEVVCAAPVGFVTDATDCDDTNAAIHPDADEVCDREDNNCVGGIDEGVVPLCDEEVPTSLTVRVVDDLGGVAPDYLGVGDGSGAIVDVTAAGADVSVVPVVDSTGRYTAVVVCPAGQDRRVFSVTGTLAELSDVTVRCPTLEPLDQTVQGDVTGFAFNEDIRVAYGRTIGNATGSAVRSFAVEAHADAHHDVIAVVSDASFRLNRLAMARDIVAGAIAADIDLVVDGFAPLEHELTVLTGSTTSVSTDAHFYSALGTVIDVTRYDFSSSPGWFALPAAELTATEVHLLEAREETFPGQRGGVVVRQAAGDVTIDVTTTAALPETALAAVDDTVSIATGTFPVGVLEAVLSTFDSVTSTQTRHTVIVTPARASSSVVFPSAATVPGFDAAWNLGVQPSGTVRVHQGAVPAAIVDVLVDGPLGHDGVAFTFGGTRLGS